MQTAQVIPFSFEANQVRTAIVEGEPWFAVKDIIRALDYSKASAPAKLVDAVPVQWKGVNPIHTPGGSQKLLMLSEQGLYFFLGRSDKPKALPFQMWLAGEVLPAIRKQGSYTDTNNKMGTLIGETIGTNGFNMLGALVKGKVAQLPTATKRRATAKIWSQTHAAFGVRSAADIPADQLDAARNFIAAYALEGEWLGKETRPQPNLSYPIATLVARRESMLTVRNDKQAWLDVTLHDLRDIRGDETPCEKLLGELHKAGYDIEGCWWELRTYRNKLYELQSWVKGMSRVTEDPHRYAVSPNGDSL